jgi:RNA polymerase sigma factor (sigma-70 family)
MVELKNLDDNMLVQEFIHGNHEAMDVLVDKYKDRLYSYIFFTVKNQELAEDLFQDTFIKVIKSLKQGKYIENGRFYSWVTRIAHNLVIDYYRKGKGQNTYFNEDSEKDEFNSLNYCDGHIEDELVFKQILDDVTNLLELLPDEQKDVVKRRFYQGLSFKEIADQTDVSINTALGRMRYAIINLRKIVEEKNIDLNL